MNDVHAVIRHLFAAIDEAKEFKSAGCFALARCRLRDARFLADLLGIFARD